MVTYQYVTIYTRGRMTYNKTHREKHLLPAATGVFVYYVSGVSVALGFFMAIALTNLWENQPKPTTYWQEKAASFNVEKPIQVTYTTPDAVALKAEIETLRHSFISYKKARQMMQAEIYKNPKEQQVETRDSTQTTPQLAKRVVQALLQDEADSFFQKVRIVEDVRTHISHNIQY